MKEIIEIRTDKNVYFISDFHLGIPNAEESREREWRIMRWMDSVESSAGVLFLVGDLFDTWMEYKHVIPKGYTRFFGKLAAWADAGKKIYIFSGNHDVWMRDYFQKEFNAEVFHALQYFKINGKVFQVAHGDGLGPKDFGYKFLKGVMRNPVAQWLYRWLHPDIGLALASYFSKLGPKHHQKEDRFMGEKEWLVLHCEEAIEKEDIDYFVFGHRHLPVRHGLSNQKAVYINLGDWIHYNTYAVFDQKGALELKEFKD